MPFIVATYVYASSQGQRTHSARTNFIFTSQFPEHCSMHTSDIMSIPQLLGWKAWQTHWCLALCCSEVQKEENFIGAGFDQNFVCRNIAIWKINYL
jgi:hypothetical protein